MRFVFCLFYGTILAILLAAGMKGPDPYYVAKYYKIEQAGSTSSYDPGQAQAYEAHLYDSNPPVISLFGVTLIDKRTPTMWRREKKVYDELLMTFEFMRVAVFFSGYVIVCCILLALQWLNTKFKLIRPRVDSAGRARCACLTIAYAICNNDRCR